MKTNRIGFSKPVLLKKIDLHTGIFYLILVFAFFVRVIGINYNTAFNDEAIYIVVGRMGLFAHDWWSYGAKLWMAGLPYIYPPLTALSFETGGLMGSRLLNIIFGVFLVEEIYRFTKLLNLFDEKTNRLAAIIAMFIAAFSGIGIFVSKLATYDIPSFFLLILGINSFLKARMFDNGKYYFLSFFCIFMAFLTKIVVAIFFPILLILSYLEFRNFSSSKKKLMLTYLYIPFFLASLLYVVFYHDNIITYVVTHQGQGKADSYFDILSLIWREAQLPIILSLPSAILLTVYKKSKEALGLLILSLVIPLFHLPLLRLATLDKHLYLSVIFISSLAGYGISLIFYSKKKILSVFAKGIIVLLIIFSFFSAQSLLRDKEKEWDNSSDIQKYLRENVKPGDKILTEEGGAIVLSLYDEIFPPKSVTTFDWIDYAGYPGEAGYTQAVSDSYFDYIQLDDNYTGENSLKEKIRKRLTNNYELAFAKGPYLIYEKKDK